MNSATIIINARYRLEPTKVFIGPERSKDYDVIDKARELQFLDGVVFSQGSESECREWVLRNREEPVEHTPGPWFGKETHPNFPGTQVRYVRDERGQEIATLYCDDPENKANAALISASPTLLALLEQYHQSFPSKESGKLICEAIGWTI